MISSGLQNRPDDAGWSSLVARRAHNPKVVGSNPIPARLHENKVLFGTLSKHNRFLLIGNRSTLLTCLEP